MYRAASSCKQALCCLQKLDARMSQDNKWAFVIMNKGKEESHGPLTCNKLAFYLDCGVLRATTLVHHCTNSVAMAKKLANYVDNWREEYRKCHRKSHLARCCCCVLLSRVCTNYCGSVHVLTADWQTIAWKTSSSHVDVVHEFAIMP